MQVYIRAFSMLKLLLLHLKQKVFHIKMKWQITYIVLKRSWMLFFFSKVLETELI